jgi:hypothetical protein
MGIIKIYNDKKWTLQFLDALYNSIDFIALLEKKICKFDILQLQNEAVIRACSQVESQKVSSTAAAGTQ